MVRNEQTPVRGSMTVTIRKPTAIEMLALWGYSNVDTASPTARLFYDKITGGGAVFWALEDGGEIIGELYAFYSLDKTSAFTYAL